MQIESSFNLIDTTISAMREQGDRMRNITSGVVNERASVPDTVAAESDMGEEAGAENLGSSINLDHLPVQMTNLNIAAHTYEANVGVLSRYKRMTETTLELLG